MGKAVELQNFEDVLMWSGPYPSSSNTTRGRGDILRQRTVSQGHGIFSNDSLQCSVVRNTDLSGESALEDEGDYGLVPTREGQRSEGEGASLGGSGGSALEDVLHINGATYIRVQPDQVSTFQSRMQNPQGHAERQGQRLGDGSSHSSHVTKKPEALPANYRFDRFQGRQQQQQQRGTRGPALQDVPPKLLGPFTPTKESAGQEGVVGVRRAEGDGSGVRGGVGLGSGVGSAAVGSAAVGSGVSSGEGLERTEHERGGGQSEGGGRVGVEGVGAAEGDQTTQAQGWGPAPPNPPPGYHQLPGAFTADATRDLGRFLHSQRYQLHTRVINEGKRSSECLVRASDADLTGERMASIVTSARRMLHLESKRLVKFMCCLGYVLKREDRFRLYYPSDNSAIRPGKLFLFTSAASLKELVSYVDETPLLEKMQKALSKASKDAYIMTVCILVRFVY